MKPARVGLLALALSQLGLGCGPDPQPSPCDSDPLRCDNGPTDWTVTTCPDVAGPLAVDLGHGDDGTFRAVVDGDTPVVHFGFQGGQHVFLSVRVAGARLDLYHELRITFWMAQGDACDLPMAPTGEAPATCTLPLGRRQVVMGRRIPLHVTPDGVVQELGILMFLTQPPVPGVAAVVAVQVEDPCGRATLAGLRYLPQ